MTSNVIRQVCKVTPKLTCSKLSIGIGEKLGPAGMKHTSMSTLLNRFSDDNNFITLLFKKYYQNYKPSSMQYLYKNHGSLQSHFEKLFMIDFFVFFWLEYDHQIISFPFIDVTFVDLFYWRGKGEFYECIFWVDYTYHSKYEILGQLVDTLSILPLISRYLARVDPHLLALNACFKILSSISWCYV